MWVPPSSFTVGTMAGKQPLSIRIFRIPTLWRLPQGQSNSNPANSAGVSSSKFFIKFTLFRFR